MTTARSPATIKKETLLRGTLGLMLGLGCVSFIEPSPYEVFFFLLIPVAILNGLTLTRTTLLLAILVMTASGAELLSLIPYIDAPPMDDDLKSTVFTASSVYLWGSALLFAIIFSRQTAARVPLALNAYAFSCVFAGCWGILSYLNVAGIGDHEPVTGRIAGPFKDPNVMGSYCVLGTVFFLQALMTGARRSRLVYLGGLVITLFGGVFLSFSRGSWGATILAALLLLVSTYLTAGDRAMRRKIVQGVGVLVFMASIGAAVVVSNETLRSTVLDRAKLQQEYDGGETGRFGNQIRSIPMLIERPLGFGPHRFQTYFGLDSHNSYVGAFSSGGWIGGCTFIIFVLATMFIALRSMFVPSPYRRYAQIVSPSLIALFLQAFQIDIDHWRFVFLMIGLVWGMESARMQIVRSSFIRSRAQLGSREARDLPAAT